MICEHCGAEVPMVQRRYDLDENRGVWVCMRCAPGLEPHDGARADGMSEELREEVRRIGIEAFVEKRAREKRDRRNLRQKAIRDSERVSGA